MPVEFGTAKTVFILAIVVGCFAVLWPKLFYPMLQSSVSNRAPIDQSHACCDVYFETDINAIKIMAEMCTNILHHHSELDPNINEAFLKRKWSKEMVNTCRSDVLKKCGIDITAFLNEKVRLGHSYKQMLDGIRSFNISVCLKTNFGVPPSLIGAPRRMRIINVTRNIRQERPPHLRPEMLHPALRERGRAIPQTHIVPRVIEKEGRPGPIPGMRPPMGGAGHVVPAPKTSSTMGIIMPMYTIGIVIFFLYTIMRVMFKKPSDHSSSYADFHPDPEFRKIVFAEDYDSKNVTCEEPVRQRIKSEPSPVWKTPEENGTKLVMTAITGLIAEVDLQREILEKRAGIQNNSLSEKKAVEVTPEMNNVTPLVHKERETETTASNKMNTPVKSLVKPSTEAAHDEKIIGTVDSPLPTVATEYLSSEPQVLVTEAKANQKVEFSTESDVIPQHAQQQGQVVVVGMDVTASCEGGGRWSRPGTPVPPPEFVVLPVTTSRSRSSTPAPFTETETQSIVLEAPLPSHTQLLVSDSETHAEPTGLSGSADTDPPVVLSGKVTLSLISLQEALAAEEEQEQKKEVKEELEQEHKQQEQQQINREQVSKDETVRAVRVNVIEDEEEEEEEEEQEEEEEEEEELEEEEDDDGKADADVIEGPVLQDTEQVRTAVTEHETDQPISETPMQQLVNDAYPGDDETPTTTNYTTASGAAEATSTTGTEETAADMSALESFGAYDDQQDDDDEIEIQGEVWNGEVQSEEEESEDEAEHQPPNVQQ